MNQASKPENIDLFLEDITTDRQGDYIYGYSEPKLLASLTYGNLAYLTNSNYFILYFTSDTLYLLTVDLTGNFTMDYVTIPYTDIEAFKVKKGIIQYILTLKIKGEKKSLKIKCNKFIVGMAWQKENIQHLIDKEWYQLTRK